MIITTSRFGDVDITGEDVLNFPEGLLGFSQLRDFVLLDDPNDEIFAWLQSCNQPEVAFPILEPELFMDPPGLSLAKSDLEILKANSAKDIRLFTIITIPDDPTQMTANLKAPIAINIKDKKGRQCVLQDNHLAIREPIFLKLQARVVQHPNQTLKSQSPGLDVAVKLRAPAGKDPQAET